MQIACTCLEGSGAAAHTSLARTACAAPMLTRPLSGSGLAVPQIPLALVDARVLAVLWPPERMGRVASAMPPGRLLRRNPHAVHGTWHDGAMGG